MCLSTLRADGGIKKEIGLVAFLCWSLWKARNKDHFENQSPDPSTILRARFSRLARIIIISRSIFFGNERCNYDYELKISLCMVHNLDVIEIPIKTVQH